MPISSDFINEKLLILIPLWLSLSLHECGERVDGVEAGGRHGGTDGPDDAQSVGHIDPIGTLLLPLLGVPFGWAKPVPVNPLRFHRGVKYCDGDDDYGRRGSDFQPVPGRSLYRGVRRHGAVRPAHWDTGSLPVRQS